MHRNSLFTRGDTGPHFHTSIKCKVCFGKSFSRGKSESTNCSKMCATRVLRAITCQVIPSPSYRAPWTCHHPASLSCRSRNSTCTIMWLDCDSIVTRFSKILSIWEIHLHSCAFIWEVHLLFFQFWNLEIPTGSLVPSWWPMAWTCAGKRSACAGSYCAKQWNRSGVLP